MKKQTRIFVLYVRRKRRKAIAVSQKEVYHRCPKCLRNFLILEDLTRLTNLCKNEEDLKKTLILKKAKYHPTCRSRYDHVMASNEIYYHKSCYWKFRRQYNSKLKDDSESNTEITWIKATAQTKIINYIYETENETPGTIFEVKMLESKYDDLLSVYGVHYESHVTRFAHNIPSTRVRKRTVANKAVLYFKTCVDDYLSDNLKYVTGFF